VGKRRSSFIHEGCRLFLTDFQDARSVPTAMSDNTRQDTTVFSLRIPKSLLRIIERAADKQSRTVSNLMLLTLKEKFNGK
jgi:hypothetical protein